MLKFTSLIEHNSNPPNKENDKKSEAFKPKRTFDVSAFTRIRNQML